MSIHHGDLYASYLCHSRSEEFFSKALDASTKDVRLLVKHVLITSDLGEYSLPKWASWVKVIIDGGFFMFNPGKLC